MEKKPRITEKLRYNKNKGNTGSLSFHSHRKYYLKKTRHGTYHSSKAQHSLLTTTTDQWEGKKNTLTHSSRSIYTTTLQCK